MHGLSIRGNLLLPVTAAATAALLLPRAPLIAVSVFVVPAKHDLFGVLESNWHWQPIGSGNYS